MLADPLVAAEEGDRQAGTPTVESKGGSIEPTLECERQIQRHPRFVRWLL